MATLDPGSYTVVLSGVNNSTGVALVEAYMLDANTTRAMNLSTRGRVGANENALIGGFIVGGALSKNVLIRGLGPSLGTSDALQNPLLELRDGSGNLIATNDDWNTSAQRTDIVATGIPPGNPRESALVIDLEPGSYTAVVRGVNGGAGLGMVEIYDLE